MGVWRQGVIGLAAVAALGFSAMQAQADEKASAEQAAASYVDQLDTADLDQVYDQDLSASFHVLMTRKAFTDLISVARIQAGGPHQAREIVGSYGFDRAPNGDTGDFYYVRFKTRFPSAVVFQDVWLAKAGDDWKVTASLATPTQ
jgi:hypothetical protein